MIAEALASDFKQSPSSQSEAHPPLARSDGAQIYVDENGRQIVLDPFTTSVLGVEAADVQPPRPFDRDRTVDRRPLPPHDAPPAAGATVPDPEELLPRAAASAEPIGRDLLDDVAKLLAEVPPTQGGGANAAAVVAPGEGVAELQVLLDRNGASPGVIDGRLGSNVSKALSAYREITGQDLQATDKAAIGQALEAGGDAFTDYVITQEDAAGPFIASVPSDYGSKAKLERLSFTSVPEMLAERFHMDEAYLKSLNPGAAFSRPGTAIKVANIGQNATTPVTRIVADKARKQVRAYDGAGKLVVAYPATIGSADTPSPSGTHAVERVAFDPDYTYNPSVNFKQGDNNKILKIPPGPNGPVGSIWIALDKPTYGIHGTPDPSKIGKTESHGCVRLTNWDAAELAKLVKAGVPVEFLD